jgi:Na+:H+ antiporter, NhaA family
LRNRRYRRICAEEERDTDADGVPDVYEAEEALD